MFSFLNQSNTNMVQTTTNESSSLNAIIQSITCPITNDIMKEPMLGTDGHTYEKSAILEWLSRNPISPQTRQPMNPSDLTVNPTITYLCDKYHNGEFGNLNTPKPSPKISTKTVNLLHSANTDSSKSKIMLSFDVDSESYHSNTLNIPQDVVLVIDHSGSMQTSVEAKDSQGNQLEAGFSIQDIVNHAAKTIAKTLDENSRLSIIIFDSEIDILFNLKPMNEINQQMALTSINTISPRGQTNIYGAIEKAIELLDIRDDKSRNSAILMLTDGIPNISPARGEVKTLEKLRIKKNFTAPIYTFGFGYSLQRELLYDIAKCANGANGHIPDGGMIATVFCNFIATILTTVVMNLQLHILTPGVTLMGDYVSNYDSDNETTIYDIGTVQYQQSRDIIFTSNTNSQPIKYFFTYKIGGASYKSDEFTVQASNLPCSNNFDTQFLRYKLIESIRTMINYNRCNQFDKSEQLIKTMKHLLETHTPTPLINGMLENLVGNSQTDANGNGNGQIELAATNPTYFKRWGEFYLDQLSRSLNQQIKPNFKDSACLFGGTLFNQILDKSSDIFDTLPPPTPSNINRSSYRSVSTTPIRMSQFNDPCGGCFTGDSKIILADQSKKLVQDLKVGDSILSLVDPYDIKKGFGFSKVVCILKTIITSGKTKLVTTEKGLKITPYHPIVSHGIWVHPKDVYTTCVEDCDAVYTLLLDKYHTFNLNGSWVIGIGHNYLVGILYHEYFGTERIVNDLKQHPDWNTGMVTIYSTQYCRDLITNDICKIVTTSNSNSNIKSNTISVI